MDLLYFFLVPVAFVYYLAGRRDSGLVSNVFSFFLGIGAAIISLLVSSLLFFFISPGTPLFWIRFLLFFLSETVFPFIGGLLLLFFLVDLPVRQRISNIRPQLFGIASVYLPYLFLRNYDMPDGWAVILFPAMLLSLLFFTDFCIERFLLENQRFTDLQDFLVAILPVFLAFLLADASKTLWFFCFPFYYQISLSFIVVAAPFVFRLAKYRS